MNSGILWKEWISLRFVETSSDGKKALTDLVLGFIKACRTDLMLRCEASGGRPVPEVSWWNGTQQVETSSSSSQEDSGGIIIIIIITIKSCSMIMMILTMTDLGFLGQAGGTREWDRSCRQWDQPKAVKVAIIMMILIMMMMMKMKMMMMIFQVRSREADLVQGSELGHHGLFWNSSSVLILMIFPRLQWFLASRWCSMSLQEN